MSFSKRVKSFLISLVSVLGTAFTTIIFTPQWSDFVDWLGGQANSFAAAHNIPTVIVILVGLFIGEVWKHILNTMILNKKGMTVASARYNLSEPDLY